MLLILELLERDIHQITGKKIMSLILPGMTTFFILSLIMFMIMALEFLVILEGFIVLQVASVRVFLFQST